MLLRTHHSVNRIHLGKMSKPTELIGDRAIATSHLFQKFLLQFPSYAEKIVSHNQIVDSKLNEVLTQLGIDRGDNTTNNLFRLWRHLSNRHWLTGGDITTTDELTKTYEIIKTLGQGAYGKVLKAKNLYYDETVALKLFANRRHDAGINENNVMQWLLEEYGEMQAHKNILGFYGSFFARYEKSVYFVVKLQYIPGETLEDLYDQQPLLSRQACLDIAIGILSGLSFLRRNRIGHRDIKPPNVIYSAETDGVCILDLGLAQFATLDGPVSLDPGKGTPLYFYPPLYQTWMSSTGHKPDNYVSLFFEADVWATALTLYMVILGKRPAYFDYMEEISDLQFQLEQAKPRFVVEMDEALRFARPEFADVAAVVRSIINLGPQPSTDQYLQKFTVLRYPLQTQL